MTTTIKTAAEILAALKLTKTTNEEDAFTLKRCVAVMEAARAVFVEGRDVYTPLLVAVSGERQYATAVRTAKYGWHVTFNHGRRGQASTLKRLCELETTLELRTIILPGD